jgi:hypothetical protein
MTRQAKDLLGVGFVANNVMGGICFLSLGWVMPAFTSGRLDKSVDNLHRHAEDDEAFAFWLVPTHD